MFRRAAALIGATLMSSAAFLGLLWLISSPFSSAGSNLNYIATKPELAIPDQPSSQTVVQNNIANPYAVIPTAWREGLNTSPQVEYDDIRIAETLAPVDAPGLHGARGNDGDLYITKTTTTSLARVGDDVTYDITVCNHGDNVLDKWSVTDSLIPGIDASFAVMLLPHTCETHSFVRTVQAGDPDPLINTATAYYQISESSITLIATDTHTLQLFSFGLDVNKTGDTVAQVGDDVNYSIEVCNTGDATLNRTSVVDSLIPGIDGAYGPSLSPGACETHNFVRTVQATDPYPWLTNIVTATYQVQGEPDVLLATDSHTVLLVTPDLSITKTGDTTANVGDSVNYYIQVCNNGDVALTRVSVNDSLIPGVDSAYGATLSPGGCEAHNFARTALASDPYPWLTNTVTATYRVDGLSGNLQATDSHTVRLFASDINVDKSGDALAQVGDDVTYAITVCNTGFVTLDKISVNDNLIPNVDDDYSPSLAPGDCETHNFVRTVQPSDPYPWLTNDVTATYQVQGQSEILTAGDSHIVRLVAPALEIIKTGPAVALVGDNVNYTIQVCNRGDLTLNKLGVSDSLIPGVNAAYGPSLAPAACESHVFTRRVQPSDPYPWLNNTASAVYQVEGLPDTLTVNDTHAVRIIKPALNVSKTGDELSRAGQDVTYPITVCNRGDVRLNKISVIDDLIPNVNDVYGPSLSPGECETRTFVRTVLPTDPHPWLTNTVTAIYQINGFPNTLGSVDTHVVRLTTPDLDITKTGDDYSKIGASVTYLIQVCNTGYVTLTRASVIDSLIPNVDDAYAVSLPPGVCETHNFGRVVQPTDPDPLVNVVTATYQVQAGPETLIATDTHSVSFPTTDLLITKSARPPYGPPSAPITFTIIYTNDSPNLAPNVTISDWLPSDTQYIGDNSGLACPSCAVGATGPLTWTIPILPPYSTGSFDLRLSHNNPPCQGILTNTVAITTVIFDSNPSNNRDTATYGIIPATDLIVVKDDHLSPEGPAFVRPGERLTYTIAYTNPGPCWATGVTLTETLPEHTDYIGIGWTHVSGRTYAQPVGDLSPGQSGHLTVVVQLHDLNNFPAGVGQITNTVRIRAREPEPASPIDDTSVVVTPLGSDWKLYVANRDSGTLDVFNITRFDYLRTITLTTDDGRQGAPFGMTVTGTRLFVADFGTDTDPAMRSPLYVIDTTNDTVIHRSPVGRHAIHVAAYQDRVYVANHSIDLEGITLVNANEPYDVIQRLECDDDDRCFGYGFFGMTVDAKRGRIYTTKRDNYYFGVWVLTPTINGPELEFVPTGGHPTSALYNPNLDRLYVTFGLVDQLWVFDPNNGLAVTEKIATGHQDPVNPGFGGHGLAYSGKCILVSNYKDKSLTAIINGECIDGLEPSPVITAVNSYSYTSYLPVVKRPNIVTIPLSGRPKGMAVVDNILFVTLPVDGNEQPWNKVAVIDLRTMRVVHEITVRGEHPHTVVLGTSHAPAGTTILPTTIPSRTSRLCRDR